MHEVIFDLVFFLAIALLLVQPLGLYIAGVYQDTPNRIDLLAGPIERFLYRSCKITPQQEMNWKEYLAALLYLNLFGILLTYAILRLQGFLPFNPQNFGAVEPYIAFNTAVSFVTNSGWQTYAGETTMSYCSQCLALLVQNFLSAATSMCVLVVLIRSFIRQETENLGNFWFDFVRTVIYVLLPLALVFAIALMSQGVMQNFKAYETVSLLDPVHYKEQNIDKTLTTQTIPMGPVASQVAINSLGSTGGGFFNVNSMHPLVNPNSWTNFLELLTIILIPAALCYTYGYMINRKRTGWMILLAMLLIFIPCTLLSIMAEKSGNPTLLSLGLENIGNLEGKELRIGVVNSSIWSTAATATSNGSANTSLESCMPMSSLIYIMLMHLGEIVFGGTGCGLYGMLMIILLAVFIAGLMVGRSPEYLGKKIEPFEMKMVAIVVLVLPLLVLLLSAWATVTTMGTAALGNPGAQGFTEILYAFTSMRNNNGSAFAGLNASTDFYTLTGSLIMLIGRFWVIIAVMAVAGSLVRKKTIPATAGTLETDSVTFLFFLLGVIAIVGALSFFPTLALGPIVDHLMLWGAHGN